MIKTLVNSAVLAVVAVTALFPAPALANKNSSRTVAQVVGAAAAVVGVMAIFDERENPTTTAPLASFGVGTFDVLDNVDQDWATDLRAEYRMSPLFYVVKPLIALQATSDGGAGAFAGLVADWVIGNHFVISPSLAAGLWTNGDGKDLGSVLEFRSQLEAGYRFDNDWRVTAAFSHISNANIGKENPGVEIGSLYLHIPASTLLAR